MSASAEEQPSQPAQAGAPKAHNSAPLVAAHTTYSSLVDSDADLIGHVAYALYKREKLKFCESIKQKHGRPATTQELDVFIHASGLPTRIESYRAEAELLLKNFSEEVLDVTTQEIQERYDAKLVHELKQHKSMPRAIFENTWGNLLSLGVIALILVVLYGSRIGVLPLVNEIFGNPPQVNDQEQRTHPTPPQQP